MEEVLRMYYDEEIQDEIKYLKLADDIEKDHPNAAGVLRDIAHEEHTHALLLKHILDMQEKEGVPERVLLFLMLIITDKQFYLECKYGGVCMWTKEFWIDAAERCIGTMAEVAIPLIPVSGATNMDWGHVVCVVAGSGLVCLLKCIVKATNKNS